MSTPIYKRNLISSTCLLLLLGLFFGCQSSPRIDQDAQDLLEKVEQTYQTTDAFRLDATITTELSSGSRNRTIEIPLTYAASSPGKMRLEVKHQRANVTLVSNGSTTWTYLAADHQYTRKNASTLQEGSSSQNASPTDQQFLSLARSLTDTYAEVTQNLESASIAGQPEISINGKTIDTYHVKTTYKGDLKSERPDANVFPTQYWIDAETHWVVKQIDAYKLPSQRAEDSVKVQETTVINNYELNPSFEEETFAFQAPDGAERVENLSFGGVGSSSMEGQQAASFSLPNLSGEMVQLSDFKGKIVLLDFWATWCAPCRRAHPGLQELHEEFRDQGLVILGINNETEQKARSYMKENGYTFPTLMDPDDAVAAKYGVSAIPYYFVIDREGVISSEIIGYHPKSDMLDALQEAGLEVN